MRGLVCGIALSALAACATPGERIGVSMALFDDNFLTVLRQGMQDHAKSLDRVSLQIEDGLDGLLLDDPLDLAGFGAAVASLLDDADRRDALGERARASVITDGMPDTALVRWGEALHAAVEHHRGRTSTA